MRKVIADTVVFFQKHRARISRKKRVKYVLNPQVLLQTSPGWGCLQQFTDPYIWFASQISYSSASQSKKGNQALVILDG
jgi:hypothetical protein